MRSDVTPDWVRLIFVVVFIPLHENGVPYGMRANQDPKYDGHHALACRHYMGWFAAHVAVQRRFYLALIKDQSIALLAIVLCGMVEALDRCSLVFREKAMYGGGRKQTEAERRCHRQGWVITIFNAMYYEVM